MRDGTRQLNRVVALGMALAAMATCLGWSQPAARAATAMSDNGFLNSIGANVNGSPTGYSPTSLANCASYLGIRWIRLDTSSNLGNYVSAHNLDTNLKFSVGAGSGGSNIASMISGGTTLANAGALLAFEAPNEVNNWTITYNGQTGGGTGNWLPVAYFQRDLYTAVKSNATLKNYPVFGVSEDGAEQQNVGLQYTTIPTGTSAIMPAGTQYSDYVNTHNYVCADGYVTHEAWNMMNPTFNGYGDPLYGGLFRRIRG